MEVFSLNLIENIWITSLTKVSMSKTFHEQLFHTNLLCFILYDCVLLTKTTYKLLVTLTIGLIHK